MSRRTRDGTAKPVSRNQIFRREREQDFFSLVSWSCEQDWQLSSWLVLCYNVMTTHAYIYTIGCTLNSRLLSGHLGFVAGTLWDLFSPSAMVRWVCNSRDPVLCAMVLLLHNVFRKIWTQLSYKLLVHCSNPREFFFIRVFKEEL